MGGLAGHMMHLYDNPDMTFEHMMGIMTQASQGKLKGTEKTDGVNIFLGYKDGTARAARNVTDAATGGMSIDDLIAREYKGGDAIRQVYVKATQAFEKAIRSLSEEETAAIFGVDGNKFYNAEVIHPDAANVINYSGNAVIIHGAGHKQYNPETNGVEDFDASTTAAHLDQAIDKFEEALADDDFDVSRMAVTTLQAMTNKEPVKAARAQIRAALSTVGLDDSAKVRDFIRAGLLQKMTDIPEEFLDIAVGRMVGDIPHNDPKVKELPKEVKAALAAHWKKAKPMIAQILSPVSMAVHDFTVEALKGLQSTLVLDNAAEVDRQKEEVRSALAAIENYSGQGSEKASEVLVQQMLKLKDVENISTAAEGFVFTDDNGDTYKFTGNFAPVNQLLGLFKYGRGKALPPIADAQEAEAEEVTEAEEPAGKRIAVMPGGFKPPHNGHFSGAKFLLEQADEVHVLISPLPRAEHDGDNRIEVTAEQSEELWNLYVRENGVVGKIKPYVVDVNSPVKAAYDFMDGMDEGDTILLGRGAKDEGDTRFAKAQSYSDKNNLGVTVEQPLIPMSSDSISGTKMRKFILAGDVQSLMDNIPVESDAGREKVQGILNITPVNESKKKVTMARLREMVQEILQEMSSMASGAVEGGGSSSTGKVIKKRRKIYDPFNEVDDRYETQASEKLPGKGIKMLQQGLQLPRSELPQVKSTDMDDFKSFLDDTNVEWEDTVETVEELEPIQAEINLENVAWMMQNKSEEELGGGKPVIISSDGYLVDGHHRWFSLKEINPQADISVVLVHKGIEELLQLMGQYPKVSFKGADEVKESLNVKIYNRLMGGLYMKEGTMRS